MGKDGSVSGDGPDGGVTIASISGLLRVASAQPSLLERGPQVRRRAARYEALYQRLLG